MKRSSFLSSLGVLAAAAFIPEQKKLTLPNHTSNADMNIGVNSVERFRIASSGNLGIGCTSPSAKLHISGGTIVTDSKGLLYLDGCRLQAV